MNKQCDFCGGKLGVRVVKLAVRVYKSLSDTERLSGLLFIKLKNLQRKNVAHSKPFGAAYTSVCLSSCLGPFRFIKYVQTRTQCHRHL